MSSPTSRIMYIERKAESLNGPARIGRVTFSKTGRTAQSTQPVEIDEDVSEEYWTEIRGRPRGGKP
jgi:hypothetical protein